MSQKRRYFMVWNDFPTVHKRADGTPAMIYAGRRELDYSYIDDNDERVLALATEYVDYMNGIWGNYHRLEIVSV